MKNTANQTTASNAATVLMTLVFGISMGIIAVVVMAYFSGFLYWDSGGKRGALADQKTGMELLNEYQCRRGETKQVFIRGVEDDFETGNDENATPSNEMKRYIERRENLGLRDFDETGMDKNFYDHFTLPSNTASGVFVVKMRPLSSLKNDFINLGKFDAVNAPDKPSNRFGSGISLLSILPGWNHQKQLWWVNLENIDFNYSSSDYDSLLAFVRAGTGMTAVDVTIGDDTQVDFLGFSVCTEPLENKGVTHIAGRFELPEGLVDFSCTRRDGLQCDQYKGDKLCSTKLPVLCFKDQFSDTPPEIIATGFERAWTGGRYQTTTPVIGSSFDTSDEVNTYCRAEFGDGWRAASAHDGLDANSGIGFGSDAAGTEAWVDVKGGKYANCWRPRPNFNDLAAKRGQDEN